MMVSLLLPAFLRRRRFGLAGVVRLERGAVHAESVDQLER
jgi:hypothetical protein